MTSRIPKSDLRVTPPPRHNRESGVMMSVDAEKLWKSIDKMASTINKSARHTEQIPDIKRKVEATGIKVVELDTKMSITNERINKVENKVDIGHQCQKEMVISEIKEHQRDSSQKIESDIQRSVKHSGEIRTIKEDQKDVEVDLENIKKFPRQIFYGLLGIIVTIITSIGGAVWFLAELNKDVEYEREQRTTQFQRIEKQLGTLTIKADQTPVHREIKILTNAVKTSSEQENEYNKLCINMTNYEKRVTKELLQKNKHQIPISCLE